MDALIDQALETLLHSAIWRSTWHMSFTTLIAVAVIAFLVLAWRRGRRADRNNAKSSEYRYRRRYRR